MMIVREHSEDLRRIVRRVNQSLAGFALLAVSLCSASSAFAQATGIEGTITDSKGGVIPKATVTAKNERTGKTVSVTADSQGHFSFASLPDGAYDIDAISTGFGVAHQVAVHAPASLMLALPIGQATTDITVDADQTHSVAAALAPMDALLSETSARTEITGTMIKNFMSPVADYGEAVEMAPGTFTTNGNGVGLGQSKTNFRGFPDGDYDIKFDGIPWSDTNSVSHHSWAFFPSQFLGGIDFDRSPGTASTIGYAPFGGSINLLSKPFSPIENVRGSVSYGSFNTKLYDGEYDSGNFGPGHKFNLNIDVHHLGSDGYQTYNFQTRNAGDIQVQYKLSDKTTITGFSAVIWLDANTPNFNATRCQMYGAGANYTCTGTNAPFAGSGINFYLTNNADPMLYLDYQYNYYHVPTDFEYVGVHKEMAHGFILDFKPYTYNYDNSEKYSNAVPITDNAALIGTTYAPLGVKITALCSAGGCGVDKYNSYRTYGETSQLSQVSKLGIFRAGMWYAWSNTNRHQYPSDPLTNWTDQALPNFKETFVQDSYQPFAEYEFHPTSKLLITPGVKFSYYTIGTKQYADNGGKIGGLGTNNPASFIANGGSYFATLPSVAGNYRITNNWSAYAQYATGTIAPPSSTFDFTQSSTGTPVATLPKQQKTTTYQTGTVLKLKRVTLDLSYFNIHFGSGYSSFTPLNTGEPVYYPTPPSITQGVEAESNISLTHGLSLYLNASYDDAKYTGSAITYCTSSAAGCTSTTPTITTPTPSGLWVASTPSDILTEGLTYQHSGWDAGIFNKTVGTQRLDDGGFHNEATISPFTLTNLFLNYTIRGTSHFNNTKLRLSFNNIFDEHNITGDSISTKAKANTITANGTSYADPFNANISQAPAAGADAITILPGRSVMFSATFGFGPKGR
ncbi:iron complex outermembrane recepter protein [Bryocella elongata]|uniref:Iron complex outermembrane recepter protein n=1 Tax=Bryocella elongata TaxID=863522 RepID=A0A1H6A2F1_9BACT|nr:TonB-dependent receptor [Bryocella elongata]SEG42631.1 iron complex outermembrane recepter protein [Bryocella elongata]